MLDIVIRCEGCIAGFLIPEQYNKKQFDALVNLPRIDLVHRMALWHQWVTDLGGKYLGPRTTKDFNALDGRHVNIKVDNDRVYVFNDPGTNTLFNIDNQWYEIYNFNLDKLPWLDWLFREPGKDLTYLTEQFMDMTGATPYTETPVTTACVVKRFYYNGVVSAFLAEEDIS